MACHAARVCGADADLLVCDRTFCSLDAVAERLMGSWASLGLQIVCRWNTDVVSDFMASKCPRIVLQDPSDEIISHCSSLKCGIASAVVLKDFSWGRRDLSWRYVESEYKRDEQVPSMIPAIPAHMPSQLQHADTDTILSSFDEAFIEHFTACVINIGRRANGLMSCRAKVSDWAVSAS